MSVAEKVRALIAEQLEVEEGKVVPEALLIEDLGGGLVGCGGAGDGD